MATADDNARIKGRIEKIRQLLATDSGTEWFEGGSLAQSVLHDTVGSAHPLATSIRQATETNNSRRVLAASRAVVSLFDEGGLRSPRLAIAHEIEGGILDIADVQVQSAERETDSTKRQVSLAIAAFLAGAALEDALRRLCDARALPYDAQRTSVAKLQTALFQPSKQIEVISGSDNKQITAWGDTRNKADHGKFSELTHSEVLTMTIGVRAFIDRHLP
jgi:hypothetical protein